MPKADGTKTSSTRSAQLSGVWYPAKAKELKAKLDEMLASVVPDRLTLPVQVLMVPNAAYDLSGHIAAEAFRHIQGYSYKRVVVIGSSREQCFNGLALPNFDSFETPLGDVKLSRKAIKKLKEHKLFQNSGTQHARENCIEIVLPFLQHVLGDDFFLLPILTGGLNKQDFKDAAEAIRPFLGGDDLLVIVGNFTHYGPNHNYIPFPPDENIVTNLKQLDQGAIEKILTWDPEGLAGYAVKTKITASILAPAILMLNLLDGQCIPRHFRYKTSAQTSQNKINSVSYCSGIFLGPTPLAQSDSSRELSGKDLPRLHTMAMQCLKKVDNDGESSISFDKLANISSLPMSLRQKRGAFVTMTKQKVLRGYMGAIVPNLSVYEAVLSAVVQGSSDGRHFPPITREEFPHIDIRISVIGPVTPVDSYKDIKLGHHGIVMHCRGLNSMYLPEVPIENNWDIEETLKNISLKAALPADAWQEEKTKFYVFTAQYYPKTLNLN